MDVQRNRRGGHRSRATVLCNVIEAELQKPEPCRDTVESSCIELERQKIDEAMLEKLDSAGMEEEISDSSEKLMKINLFISKAKQFLFGNRSNTSNESRQITNTLPRLVNLPQLTLVKFSGDPLDWLKFWELFRSSVHERTDIQAPVKFQYLTGQLEGDAARLLSGFNHSEAEYYEAIELLKNTYGQPRILVQARLNALLDLPAPEPTVKSLSNFRSSYEGHLRVLKCLDCNIQEAGYVYAHILLRKLPFATRDNLNRAKKPGLWSLEQLRDSINEEIQHLSSLQEKTKQGSNVAVVDYSNMQTASFAVGATSNPKFCRFCSKNHLSHSCESYNSVKMRKQRVNELKLCFNCLLPNHSVAKCHNKGRCRQCGKKHHSSLCTRQTPITGVVKDESKPSTTSNTIKPTSSMITTTTMKGNNFSAILPTANVTLVNDTVVSNCKALLDPGSQRTFLLNAIAKQLNLIPHNTVSLEVDGFDSIGVRKTYDVVKLTVITKDGNKTIDAITVEHMPTRLSMPGRGTIVNNLKQQGIELADDSGEDSFVNLHLIIGVDNYHKFVYSNQVHNIFAVPSNLGTLIAGTLPIANEQNDSTITTSILKIAAFSPETELEYEIQKLWDFDTVGIKEPNEVDLAIKKFQEKISC